MIAPVSTADLVRALLGGALIGVAASALLGLGGRVAGISGIVGGLLPPRGGDASWRVSFLLGLLAGGLVLVRTFPEALHVEPSNGALGTQLAVTLLGGLLVGVGTRLSGGCTSGHGVCGLSRGSTRSMVATATFMAAGMATVFLVRHAGVFAR